MDDINDCIIVLFDNGSGNGSMELLSKVYADKNNVVVGGSKVNMGFSEGNNAAYKLALKHRESFDFVVAMNSDVMIHQKDFISRIKKYVEEDKQSVIGPEVYNSRRKEHESPLYLEIPSAMEIDRLIESQEWQMKNIDTSIAQMRRSEIKARVGKVIPDWMVQMYRGACNNRRGFTYKAMYQDPVLSGCCLIYLRRYLEHEILLFEPDTFLYGEEILLSIKCKTKGYRTLYDPGLKIEHKESVSTKANKTNEEFVRQKKENLIHAYKIVKKCIENNPWE